MRRIYLHPFIYFICTNMSSITVILKSIWIVVIISVAGKMFLEKGHTMFLIAQDIVLFDSMKNDIAKVDCRSPCLNSEVNNLYFRFLNSHDTSFKITTYDITLTLIHPNVKLMHIIMIFPVIIHVFLSDYTFANWNPSPSTEFSLSLVFVLFGQSFFC